jgi:hypothetical protein
MSHEGADPKRSGSPSRNMTDSSQVCFVVFKTLDSAISTQPTISASYFHLHHPADLELSIISSYSEGACGLMLYSMRVTPWGLR